MMIEENFPSYLSDAEKVSARGQRAYLRLTYLGLFAAIVASVGGGISTSMEAGGHRIELGGGISGLSFLASIFFSYYLISTKPEGEWYKEELPQSQSRRWHGGTASVAVFSVWISIQIRTRRLCDD